MRFNYLPRRDLCFEKLEDRQLLAVTPAWDEKAGRMELKSDGTGDNIVVYSQVFGDGFVAAMADAPPGTVVFNGLTLGASITEVKTLDIYGGGGNDTINLSSLNANWELGKNSNPAIWAYGDAGNDSIVGSPIHNTTDFFPVDFLVGGDNDDTLSGDGGRDEIHGDGGNDSILGGTRRDFLRGGAGNDIIKGGDDDDDIRGGIGDDTIAGDNGSTVVGAAYDDLIYGDETTASANDGNDLIDGEFGDDKIYGGGGVDALYGGGKSDSFGGGNDWISGGDGNDDIFGDQGHYASVSVASGNDTLSGDGHNDMILGGDLTDYIDGGTGCDDLWGDGGKDSIYGGAGDDYANGGSGEAAGYNPVMSGGSGKDTFEPDYPTDTDASEPCGGGLGPQTLEGGPVLLADNTVGFRDQRFLLPLLSVLDERDLYMYLHYYSMTDEQIDTVRRWRSLYLASDFAALAAVASGQNDCGCGNWSA